MNPDAPVFLVTGASSGIGREIVARLAAAGWSGFAMVRRPADAPPGATAIVADVTASATLQSALDRVRRSLAGRPLSALVVNAGIALPGPLLHQPVEEIRRVFDVNVFGAVATVQTFASLMLSTARPARIVAISSVSGKIAAPLIGAYAASKHALEALCDSLRRELMVHGIDVIVVEPGPVATPIWRKSLAGCRERYAATSYGPVIERVLDHLADVETSALPPSRVADVVFKALTARRPRSRYVVTADRFAGWLLPRLLPDRMLDRLIASRLGFNDVGRRD